MPLTEARIRELEKAERKLNALENAGVDNWDGYDFAMEEIAKEEAYDEYIDDIVGEILERVGECIEEPAGRGCGYGISSKGGDLVAEYLRTLRIPMKKESDNA